MTRGRAREGVTLMTVTVCGGMEGVIKADVGERKV